MLKWLFKRTQKNENVAQKTEFDDLNDSVLKVGNSAIVNDGVKDPDNGNDIGYRQGRISEIDDGLVTIQWDSITLRNMPADEIEKCEKEGTNWSDMILAKSEVTKTQPRDTIKDVEKIKEKLEKDFWWSDFGVQGKRIKNVITSAISDDYDDLFQKWKKYFEKSLRFPFVAIVDDWEQREPFHQGDKVNVLSISESSINDMYGVFAIAEKDGKTEDFPFCCLKVTDKKSQNRQILSDYSFWFTNKP